jgi:hypothetical protein
MLIFALIHDEDNDQKSGWERHELFEGLYSKGIKMVPKSTLDREAEKARQAAMNRDIEQSGQRQQEDQQQWQLNPDLVFSGVEYVIKH